MTVRVGVELGLGVGLAVGTGLAVGVGFAEGVGVGPVPAGPGLGVSSSLPPPQAAKATAAKPAELTARTGLVALACSLSARSYSRYIRMSLRLLCKTIVLKAFCRFHAILTFNLHSTALLTIGEYR